MHPLGAQISRTESGLRAYPRCRRSRPHEQLFFYARWLNSTAVLSLASDAKGFPAECSECRFAIATAVALSSVINDDGETTVKWLPSRNSRLASSCQG